MSFVTVSNILRVIVSPNPRESPRLNSKPIKHEEILSPSLICRIIVEARIIARYEFLSQLLFLILAGEGGGAVGLYDIERDWLTG